MANIFSLLLTNILVIPSLKSFALQLETLLYRNAIVYFLSSVILASLWRAKAALLKLNLHSEFFYLRDIAPGATLQLRAERISTLLFK